MLLRLWSLLFSLFGQEAVTVMGTVLGIVQKDLASRLYPKKWNPTATVLNQSRRGEFVSVSLVPAFDA